MRPRLLALALAAGLAGCGAADRHAGPVQVLVTRDFGHRGIAARVVRDPGSATTAAALLRRVAGPGAAAGGSVFVNGVDGEGGRAVRLHGGDRVWLDRHADSAARPAAVVGAYPEPFAHGIEGKRLPVVLECVDGNERACATVSERLRREGVLVARRTPGTGTGAETLRILLGGSRELRRDPALASEQLAAGAFARFTHGGRALALLDPSGRPAATLGAGAGLIAAVRVEERAPTWLVTGTDATGVEAAAAALGRRRLRGRFALALDGAGERPLPVVR